MNNDRTFTNFEKHGDVTRLVHNYPHRPSWKSYGQGRGIVELSVNPKWPSIEIHGVELPENNRGTKEVYLTVPLEPVIELLTKLGFTITPPKKD